MSNSLASCSMVCKRTHTRVYHRISVHDSKLCTCASSSTLRSMMNTVSRQQLFTDLSSSNLGGRAAKRYPTTFVLISCHLFSEDLSCQVYDVVRWLEGLDKLGCRDRQSFDKLKMCCSMNWVMLWGCQGLRGGYKRSKELNNVENCRKHCDSHNGEKSYNNFTILWSFQSSDLQQFPT